LTAVEREEAGEAAMEKEKMERKSGKQRDRRIVASMQSLASEWCQREREEKGGEASKGTTGRASSDRNRRCLSHRLGV
jgi:hypothetical protein